MPVHKIIFLTHESGSAGTLLRNNSIASKLFTAFAKIIGTDFLNTTLSEVIKDICKNASSGGASLEVKEYINLE